MFSSFVVQLKCHGREANYVLSNEPGHSVSYKTACAPSEYLDQPAHPRSLIRSASSHSVSN